MKVMASMPAAAQQVSVALAAGYSYGVVTICMTHHRSSKLCAACLQHHALNYTPQAVNEFLFIKAKTTPLAAAL
jgi:hypothetical protein